MNPIIWTYWHQGFDKAPFVIQKCIEQVRRLHPEYTIHFLDRDSVYHYAEKVPIPDEKWERMALPHRSDLLRTQLLIKHGGVWMDPTVYCMHSLNEWLPEYMKAGVFFFHRPGPDRILANWFIAAEPENYLLKTLYKSLVAYWNNNNFVNLGESTSSDQWLHRWVNGRFLGLSQIWFNPLIRKILNVHPYMIYHFMAYRLVKQDLEFRRIWNNMPKIPADGPHRLKRLGLLKPITVKGRELIDQAVQPVYKLDWKLNGEPKNGSLLDYLFQHTR